MAPAACTRPPTRSIAAKADPEPRGFGAGRKNRSRVLKAPRIVLVTFGTLGDVLPFCVLGRELSRRGCEVRFVTVSDYHERVRRYGLEPVETGEPFEALVKSAEFETLFSDYFHSIPATLRRLLALRHRMQARMRELALCVLDEIHRADVVVYNPFAYFAGIWARELGRPAVRVICQPLLPTRKESLSLLGGRLLGGLGNRLSYEALRPLAPLAGRTFRDVRKARGIGGGLSRFGNPLTAALRDVHHVAAYSTALSPDPGDWPVPVVKTGAWYTPPAPGAMLQDYLEAFLAAGPPPVYVGFGSMVWGAKRNTEVVLKALAIHERRAIVCTGTGGGLLVPDWSAVPPYVQVTSHADHALLFPRVAAVVHHGGAGTTATALRAGRPSVVLPHLGDQLYWGRRVAAVGAGPPPIPLSRVTPEDLADRIERACTDPAMAAAAADVAARMAQEPGVEAAADFIAGLSERPRALA